MIFVHFIFFYPLIYCTVSLLGLFLPFDAFLSFFLSFWLSTFTFLSVYHLGFHSLFLYFAEWSCCLCLRVNSCFWTCYFDSFFFFYVIGSSSRAKQINIRKELASLCSWRDGCCSQCAVTLLVIFRFSFHRSAYFHSYLQIPLLFGLPELPCSPPCSCLFTFSRSVCPSCSYLCSYFYFVHFLTSFLFPFSSLQIGWFAMLVYSSLPLCLLLSVCIYLCFSSFDFLLCCCVLLFYGLIVLLSVFFFLLTSMSTSLGLSNFAFVSPFYRLL